MLQYLYLYTMQTWIPKKAYNININFVYRYIWSKNVLQRYLRAFTTLTQNENFTLFIM